MSGEGHHSGKRRARPPLDAVGQDVMNFSYRAVDGGTGSISSAAAVLISTTSVNDPPVPSNMTLVTEPPRATVLKPFATVLQPFEPTELWQLALEGGARVKVLQIHEDGGAEVRDATGTTGLVPACYLDLPPPPPVQ